MSGLLVLTTGLVGQWLLGVAVAHTLLSLRSDRTRDGIEEPRFVELAGLGWVLGIGLTAWGLFIWSLCGGSLGWGSSLLFAALGFLSGGPVVVKRLRHRAANRPSSSMTLEQRQDRAWRRGCQVIIGWLFVAALAQTLMTPHRYWDERSIFALKGRVLFEDQSIRSRDLADPDFVQYHPRYPLLIPLAEQHVYALLGTVDDRISKVVFPLLYFGLVLSFAGVLSRHLTAGAAWLFALLVATVPVLMPFEYGFLCGQADAPMATYHGLAVLYLWDAYERSCRGDEPSCRVGSSLLAGLCGALAAFTKDEGIAFLLVDVVALALLFVVSRPRACTARLLLTIAGCSAILLTPWFLHRRGLPMTTEMNYFGRASWSLLVERLPVLAWMAPHFMSRMFWEWRLWGLHWCLLLASLVLAPRRAWTTAQMLLLLDVIGSLMSLMLAGMLAPAELGEHISGSSHRFLMQLVPVAVLFAAGQFAPRRDFVESAPAPAHLAATSKQNSNS